jgi:Fe-Mn family superoxide dismutase
LAKYPKLLDKNINDLIRSSVPDDVRQAVINNGGGHLNHFLFFGKS